MLSQSEVQVLQHLAQFVSEHKKNLVTKILDQRTQHLTVVLEDIYQSQNASAVIRTAECMGIQTIHIVENKTKYSVNPRVVKGSHKWIDLIHHADPQNQNTRSCFDLLRKDGYRILVADPSETGTSIHDIDITQSKYALVFGNELHGVSSEALTESDQRIKIPMYGFTESLNLSVSVAICMNTLITKMRNSPQSFGLTDFEKDTLRLSWYRKMVKKSDIIEQEFLRTIQ